MRGEIDRPLQDHRPVSSAWRWWRRSLAEFLRVPLGILVGFTVLAVVSVVLDEARIAPVRPLRQGLARLMPQDSATGLITAIGQGMVTVTSITFSVLLLAVQQTASSFTPVVFDQFLRRRANQVYFGFMVGLSFYTFLVTAAVRPTVAPVFGAALGLLLTCVALILLVLLIYGTVDQMRPATVVRSIHALALAARRHEVPLLTRTRPEPRLLGDGSATDVRASETGYVVDIDLARLERAARSPDPGTVEFQLDMRLGTHVVFGDPIGAVRTHGVGDHGRAELAEALRAAVVVDRVRDIDTDPGYAVDELANIAWAGGSSALQNPETAITASQALRDLLARWTAAGVRQPAEPEPLPVVYADGLPNEVIHALASLLVVSAESRQHMLAAELLTAFARLLPRLDDDEQQLAVDGLHRALPVLRSFPLSFQLDRALSLLHDTLCGEGRIAAAEAVAGVSQRLCDDVRQVRFRPGGRG